MKKSLKGPVAENVIDDSDFFNDQLHFMFYLAFAKLTTFDLQDLSFSSSDH